MTRLRATYRLQLTPAFGFAEAERRIPYLRDLGISHLYLSPSLQARTGSEHGYDVVDPTSLSADLGGEPAFRSLVAAAHGAGLGIVLDIVPNHMAVDDANRFWTEPALRSRFFDIDPETGRHRRFFDIDDLAGVRQEDPSVFQETHALVLSLVREGFVDALRIDHPDGMRDPAGYLTRLREGGADTVWVEKILEPVGATARLAGRRDRRVRVPQRGLRGVRRPARGGGADGAVGGGVRRRAPVSSSSRSRPSASRPPARSPPSWSDWPARTPLFRSNQCERRSRRCRCTGPMSTPRRAR